MAMTTPWHARLAFILALLLPIYFMVAALGTKFGAWDWQTGLLTLTAGVGLALMGAIALLALVSLVLVLIRPPRIGWSSGVGALVIVGALFGFLAISASAAGDNPISDVSTDTANPPSLSPKVLSDRAEEGANPLNDYATPLKDTEMFGEAEEPLASQSHADIIAQQYPDLTALPLGKMDVDSAASAIQLVMAEMGFRNIRYNPEMGTVEGMAETFWFGFKDDIVARIGEDKIDFRSVSRVGRSDLGANAKRITALRTAVAAKLAELQKRADAKAASG